MSVLHHGMPDVAQFGGLPDDFLVQPCIGISAALVRGIRALLPAEVHPAIGRVVPGTAAAALGWRLVFRTETLQTGRSFDQRAIHREVLINQQVEPISLHHHLVKELAADVRPQQAFAIPGECGVVEARLDQVRLDQVEARLDQARSLRTENRLISKLAFSSRSGGIDGRPCPSAAYSRSNCGESSASAASANCLIVRSGCFAGIRLSGSMNASMLAWGFVRPRTPPHYSARSFYRKTFVNDLLKRSVNRNA
jgi:hypothetical protein